MDEHTDIVAIKKQEENIPDGKAISKINKKRYAEIQQQFSELFPEDQMEVALGILRKVLNFNPNAKAYTLDQIKKQTECMKKLAESKGVSMYTITKKKYYENNKEKCQEWTTQYRRARKEREKAAEALSSVTPI